MALSLIETLYTVVQMAIINAYLHIQFFLNSDKLIYKLIELVIVNLIIFVYLHFVTVHG